MFGRVVSAFPGGDHELCNYDSFETLQASCARVAATIEKGVVPGLQASVNDAISSGNTVSGGYTKLFAGSENNVIDIEAKQTNLIGSVPNATTLQDSEAMFCGSFIDEYGLFPQDNIKAMAIVAVAFTAIELTIVVIKVGMDIAAQYSDGEQMDIGNMTKLGLKFFLVMPARLFFAVLVMFYVSLNSVASCPLVSPEDGNDDHYVVTLNYLMGFAILFAFVECACRVFPKKVQAVYSSVTFEKFLFTNTTSV
jgi:hypothetical protein